MKLLEKLSKTPVSYLQEQLLLKHMCPKYELVFCGTNSQNPKFTFKVQVGELFEEGSGKSKQEAKHKAAEKMLRALHLIEDDSEEKEEEEDQNEGLVKNYIGDLKEFCQSQSYPDPKYDLEETAGPSHSKIFKMVCHVSNIRQDGIAKTKKAAKHIAAKNMLRELKQCVKKDLPSKEVILIPEVTLSPESVAEKYKNAKGATSQTVHNPLVFYRDHHNAYIDLHEISPTLTRLMNENVVVDHQNSVQLAEDIAKELNVRLSMCTSLSTSDENRKLVLISMAVSPPISEIGVSYENAAFKLLKTLLILSK